MILTLDVETTTKCKGHPFTPENWLVSYSIKKENKETTFHYYNEPDFISNLRNAVSQCSVLVTFSGKFELHWLNRVGVEVPLECKIFDVTIAEYVLTGQKTTFASLNQVLEEYGFPLKVDQVAELWNLGIDTSEINRDILEEYNNYDVEGTYNCYKTQLTLLTDKQLKLVYLMGEDMKALAAAEQAGIKFNHEKATTVIRTYNQQLQEIETQLRSYLPAIPSGCSFNWDSGDQLSAFLYGGKITYEWAEGTPAVYQSGEKKGLPYIRNRWFSKEVVFQQIFKPLEESEISKTKNDPTARIRFYQTDDPTLKQLKCRSREQKSIITSLQKRAKTIKVIEMINSIKDRFIKYNWQDNLMHGQYNQTVAATGRLTSSNPNQQNFSVEVDELLISRYDAD